MPADYSDASARATAAVEWVVAFLHGKERGATMAPKAQPDAVLRASLGALAPVVLIAALVAGRFAAPVSDAAALAGPQQSQAGAQRAARPPLTSGGYDDADDWRGFVERAMSSLHDPEIDYYVSQALEECHTLSATYAERDVPWTAASGSLSYWKRLAAEAALLAPCRGFEGRSIDPREVLALLQQAAQQGEPHARARMLLLRDIAAPKSEVMANIPALLASRDPAIVRDVGAFLVKGETSLRYGGLAFDAATAAIAWELVACDLGYPCGATSRLVLAQCAFAENCDAYRYDVAIARQEPPQRMADAERLRASLLHALQRNDWGWLGLFDDLDAES